MTVLGLITKAAQRLGALNEGDGLTADQAQSGLDTLNDYVASVLANDRLAIYSITRFVWNLSNSVASYTVGLGATVNTPRPVTMTMQGCNVTFIDTAANPSIELPLWMATDDSYEAIAQKTLYATYPTTWYYNPTYTDASNYATLTFWPIPNVSTLQGVIYAPAAVQEFTSLTQTVALPPGYRRFLRDNLAIELATDYTVIPQDSLVASAREAKAVVLASNTRLMDLSVDLALVPRRQRANIYTGP